ncbi:MAG TPA: hypothetical protein VNT75_27540 [Symbiobacteriaceae bacterium]|nr:hypothetical protein [Symbiobacteriaceae bacterium]
MIALVYILLTLAGLFGAVVTWFRSPRKADVAIHFFLAMALVMLADWIAFGWFGLYEYHPHLLATTVADAALGEFLADIVFVPSLSVMLGSILPGLAGILAGSVLVTGLEILFLQWDIFHQHGWQIWGTAVGFLFYFALLDLFWKDLRDERLPIERLRLIVRGCSLFSTIALLTLALRGAEVVVTKLQVVPTYYGNQALGRFIWYMAVPFLPAYWALSGKGAARWGRVGALTAAIYGLNWFLTSFDLQHFLAPWSPLLDALAQGLAISAAGLLEDLLISSCLRQRMRGGSPAERDRTR